MNNIVGEKVRKIRKKLGMTQEELALKCNLTQGYINFLETGKRGYTKKNLEIIAKTLNIPLSELFVEETVSKSFNAKYMVAEPDSFSIYDQRESIYREIVKQLDKLPKEVVEHYKMLLDAEVLLRNEKR